MNGTTRRDLVAAAAGFHTAVPSPDRFARTEGRPERPQPLMRMIEAAHLLPDLSCSQTRHRVPRTAVYEETCSAFARGTLVQAADGPIAIEDLLPGDYIETSKGAQPVLWIGATTLFPGAAGEGSTLTDLTRVMADTFGPERPARDLVLGPGARMKREGAACAADLVAQARLSPVREAVDGVNVIRLTPPTPVQLYHIAFRRHAVFQAGGLEVESYHPGEDLQGRLGEHGRALLLSLFPHLTDLRDFGPLALPRSSADRPDARVV